MKQIKLKHQLLLDADKYGAMANKAKDPKEIRYCVRMGLKKIREFLS